MNIQLVVLSETAESTETVLKVEDLADGYLVLTALKEVSFVIVSTECLSGTFYMRKDQSIILIKEESK